MGECFSIHNIMKVFLWSHAYAYTRREDVLLGKSFKLLSIWSFSGEEWGWGFWGEL